MRLRGFVRRSKMNEKTMFTKLNKKIVISTLALLSVIGSVFKIFVGFDIDEAFIIVQGCRLYQGEVLFADMWEIYQTSAIFLTPLISFWGRECLEFFLVSL